MRRRVCGKPSAAALLPRLDAAPKRADLGPATCERNRACQAPTETPSQARAPGGKPERGITVRPPLRQSCRASPWPDGLRGFVSVEQREPRTRLFGSDGRVQKPVEVARHDALDQVDVLVLGIAGTAPDAIRTRRWQKAAHRTAPEKPGAASTPHDAIP